MKGFLSGFLFRPQGKPMIFPYTVSAKVSQFPWAHHWHEAWVVRYLVGAMVFITFPLYWKIDQKLTSKENKALWREKRKKDAEHHRHHLEKQWEVRT